MTSRLFAIQVFALPSSGGDSREWQPVRNDAERVRDVNAEACHHPEASCSMAQAVQCGTPQDPLGLKDCPNPLKTGFGVRWDNGAPSMVSGTVRFAVGGRTVHRGLIGLFTTRAAAKAARDRVQRMLGRKMVVTELKNVVAC